MSIVNQNTFLRRRFSVKDGETRCVFDRSRGLFAGETEPDEKNIKKGLQCRFRCVIMLLFTVRADYARTPE